MNIRPSLCAAVLSLALAGSASAATFEVFSAANSSSGGIGLATVSLTLGQQYSVSAALDDTWSLGSNVPCTRESNADGLTACYNSHTQGNLSTRFGTLVGQIGNGAFFVIGSSFLNQIATGTGTLFLYNWDSNSDDNSGSIMAQVSAVPVPAAGGLLLAGLAGIAALRRRKSA